MLESSPIPALLRTVNTANEKTIVISDTTTKCQLPIAAEERTRQKRAYERLEPRLKRGESVDLSELWPKPFSSKSQLVVGPGKIVPREMVMACRAGTLATVPRLELTAPVEVVFERGAVVEAEFRKDINPWNDRWNRRHPASIGLIGFARPVYSKDGAAAGVYVYHFLAGFGGGGRFCFLVRDGDSWELQWEDVIWFE